MGKHRLLQLLAEGPHSTLKKDNEPKDKKQHVPTGLDIFSRFPQKPHPETRRYILPARVVSQEPLAAREPLKTGYPVNKIRIPIFFFF